MMDNQEKRRIPRARTKKNLKKIHFNQILTDEEEKRMEVLQVSWGLPTRAETFRKMLSIAYEQNLTKEQVSFMEMFKTILSTLEGIHGQHEKFRADLTRDVRSFITKDLGGAVSKVGNAADRITMVTENGTEKLGNRIEAGISITRQMELDLKHQLGAILKVSQASLIRYKVEQALVCQQDPDYKDVLERALAQTGLAGV